MTKVYFQIGTNNGNDLFKKMVIRDNPDIVILQIDTEGFDTEIIKMIDLSKYTINRIRFEKWGFKTECFTDYHNEKSHCYK